MHLFCVMMMMMRQRRLIHKYTKCTQYDVSLYLNTYLHIYICKCTRKGGSRLKSHNDMANFWYDNIFNCCHHHYYLPSTLSVLVASCNSIISSHHRQHPPISYATSHAVAARRTDDDDEG